MTVADLMNELAKHDSKAEVWKMSVRGDTCNITLLEHYSDKRPPKEITISIVVEKTN